nr:cytochrome P450 [Actinomadura rugatobispora]
MALVDPSAYADGRFERACAVLRRHTPVRRMEPPGFEPFYALTKHEDVHAVERQSELFAAAPRHRLVRADADPEPVRTLVSMDPPDHTAFRALVADWFRPRRLRAFEEQVRGLAKAAVDAMAERSGPYDFVPEISMQYPLTVICSMLGVPESDRGMILQLTQRSFGSEDPEYQALTAVDDPNEALMEFVNYFSKLVEDRLAHPTDDIASLLAHGEVNGERLELFDLLGYFGILATAGHDTTSSTIAGGLHALIEHPGQLDRLRADPSLVPLAVEEMIRWTTPVKSFMRTATADTEIRGEPIPEGEAVLLLYPSANRDEDVFNEPDRFDIGRDHNPHLAFGQGAHYCLGAHLARMEARAFFEELLPRLRHIEPAGDAELIKTLFVGGLKHLPIRAEVA